MDDAELIAKFCENRSDDAFAALVRQHVPIKAGVATLLVTAVTIPILWQLATIRRQAAELEGMRDVSAQLDQLRDENARLFAVRVDPKELARLRDGYSELMRLRAEVARLRATPVSATAIEVEHIAAQGKPQEQSDNEESTQFQAGVNAPVPASGTLLTGGWMTAPGRRSLVFLRPTVIGSEVEAGQVLVDAEFVEAPQDLWMNLGLEYLFAETDTVSHGLMLDPAEVVAITERLKESEGVDRFSAPRIMLLDGKQGKISDGGPSRGTGRPGTGASVDLLPKISADGRTVELTVIAVVVKR